MDSKIARIVRTTNSEKRSLEFEYDAMGNRIAKHVYLDNTFAELSLEKSTYYVRDASGNTMSVYEKTYDLVEEQTSYLLTERHIYGSSRLGMDTEHIEMIGEQPDTLHRRLGLKQYELSNHLGNVLSVINDIKLPVLAEDGTTIISYTAVVVSATDYSAFGVALYGRTWSSDSYRYGFNGKEKDNEGMGGGNQTYDYGFRIYNPSLGKFLSVDPLCGSYPWYTPYQFAGNKPIIAIDLDGLEEFIVTNFYDAAGSLYRTEVQVTDTYDISNNQIAHYNTVTLNAAGNATVTYIGSCTGNTVLGAGTTVLPAEINRLMFFNRPGPPGTTESVGVMILDTGGLEIAGQDFINPPPPPAGAPPGPPPPPAAANTPPNQYSSQGMIIIDWTQPANGNASSTCVAPGAPGNGLAPPPPAVAPAPAAPAVAAAPPNPGISAFLSQGIHSTPVGAANLNALPAAFSAALGISGTPVSPTDPQAARFVDISNNPNGRGTSDFNNMSSTNKNKTLNRGANLPAGTNSYQTNSQAAGSNRPAGGAFTVTPN